MFLLLQFRNMGKDPAYNIHSGVSSVFRFVHIPARFASLRLAGTWRTPRLSDLQWGKMSRRTPGYGVNRREDKGRYSQMLEL